jgi:hypothetical protein
VIFVLLRIGGGVVEGKSRGTTELRSQIFHIPPNLVVKLRRLPPPLEVMKAFVHLGSSAAPTF